MEFFFQQLFNGLVIGAFLALMTIGFSMTYGVIRLANFAHGDIGYMMGVYLAVTLYRSGLPIALSLLLSILLSAGLGLLIVRIAYRPVFGAPGLVILLTTIGVSIFLENLSMLIWGAEMRPFPVTVFNPYFSIGPIRIFFLQVVVIILTAIVAGGLHLFIQHTMIGKSMRATAEDMEAARMMGIAVEKVVNVTFAIGTVLGSVAGILFAAYYNSIHPMMGFIPTLKAFCTAVLGGIGSLPGALLGGMLMGIVEALGAGYIDSGFRDGFVFLLLFIFLVFRPHGLFGKKQIRGIRYF